MKVIERTTRNGKPFGFIVDDGGLILEVLDRGLYQEMYMTALIDAGYKYTDYNCNIISPDGINIQDLASRESTASEDEIQMLVDEAESAMPESECLRYFTVDTTAERVQFKECVNPEIKTREEFIEYLKKCQQQYMSSGQCFDARPINSFVAQEALFDISEPNLDKDVRDYFYIMSRRRRIPSFAAYKSLIKYLVQKGVLNTNEPTPTELMQAYLSWGIDGINTPCFRTQTKMNVDGEIHAMNEAATLTTIYSNRRPDLVLMDQSGKLYADDEVIDGYEVINWGREVVVPSSEDKYNELLAKSGSWKSKYAIIGGLTTPKRDRVYFDFMTEDGYPYVVKVQHDRMCVFDSYSCFFDTHFILVKGIDGKYTSLDNVSTSNAYYTYNMCLAKACHLITSVTKPAPVESSYELYRKEGLNPDAALKFIARRINENMYGCASTSDYGKLNFYQAPDLYRTGPTQTLIDKYNPNNESYNSLDELIDIMLDTQSTMINDGTYAQAMDAASQGGFAGMDTEQELRMKPLECLGFVKSCFEGNVAIEFLGDGLNKDAGENITSIARLLRTMLYVTVGSDPSPQQVAEFLKGVEHREEFDMSTLLYPRDNAFRGYIKDRAILNGRRGAEACYILYVTKVFREIANVPAKDCRHYMFEAFALDVREKMAPKNRAAQIALSEAVKQAAKRAGLLREQQFIVDKASMDLASKVFVGLIFGNMDVVTNEQGKYVDVSVAKGFDLRVIIPEEVIQHIATTQWGDSFKYMSLCDYCANEIAPNQRFNFYCINADIDPWKVTPKAGVSIPEYNFFINFCDEAWFKGFSDGWKAEVARNNSKVVTLYNKQYSTNLVEYTDLDMEEDKAPQDVTTIDSVLSEVVAETFNLYRQRFQLHNNAAREQGKYLKRMRLKSDVRFMNYAPKCGVPIMEEDEYDTLTENKEGSYFAKEHIPDSVNDSNRMLEQKTAGTIVRRFDISDYTYEDAMRWYQMMSGQFVPTGAIYGYCGFLMVVDGSGNVKKLKISDITEETADELCANNMAYQLKHKKYYIPAANGDIVLEVG